MASPLPFTFLGTPYEVGIRKNRGSGWERNNEKLTFIGK